MDPSKVFSIEGRSLKLDNASDIEPHISSLRSKTTVEEIRLGGNTLGVEACKALADVLETKKTLQVSPLSPLPLLLSSLGLTFLRSPT